uniref:AI-2E family transporter n=1 Tax=Noctiluca scintillans TaxID=2966 RepID=A0A7S1AMR7_NOCSC
MSDEATPRLSFQKSLGPIFDKVQTLTGDDAKFHESATFLGIWVLVFLVGVHTLASMRTILEPLLWATFIMMILMPVTNFVEQQLLKLCCCEHRNNTCVGSARQVAVCVVVSVFVTIIGLVVLMIYRSAVHMEHDWVHYETGARNLAHKCNLLFAQLTQRFSQHLVDRYTEKTFSLLQSYLSDLLSSLVEQISNVTFLAVMTLLYIGFWLSEPIPLTKQVADLFQRYILLKTLASSGYAICIFALLYSLGVDLSVVFGLFTFLLNFIPEVGPIIAMVLPLPVILLDGRLDDPITTAVLATLGALSFKCFWGNIVETMLIGRDDVMRMHPVVVLFCVAFFGWIWGGTGMLLSVPIVAVFKSTAVVLPTRYRNWILVTLEGDTKAPSRYASLVANSPGGKLVSETSEDEPEGGLLG